MAGPQEHSCLCVFVYFFVTFGTCDLDAYMNASTTFKSLCSNRDFRVHGCINCNSEHVVYLIECTRCSVQGVGECSDVRRRMRRYLSAIDRGPPEPVPCCSILRLFLDGQHTALDFRFTLIDKIPAVLNFHPGVPSTSRTLTFFVLPCGHRASRIKYTSSPTDSKGPAITQRGEETKRNQHHGMLFPLKGGKLKNPFLQPSFLQHLDSSLTQDIMVVLKPSASRLAGTRQHIRIIGPMQLPDPFANIVQ